MQSDGSIFPIILMVESRKGADFSGRYSISIVCTHI